MSARSVSCAVGIGQGICLNRLGDHEAAASPEVNTDFRDQRIHAKDSESKQLSEAAARSHR